MEATIYDLSIALEIVRTKWAIRENDSRRAYLTDNICEYYNQIFFDKRRRKRKCIYDVEMDSGDNLVFNRYAGEKEWNNDDCGYSVTIDITSMPLTQKEIADKLEKSFGWRPEEMSPGIDVVLRDLYDVEMEINTYLSHYNNMICHMVIAARNYIKERCHGGIYYHNGNKYTVHSMGDKEDLLHVFEFQPYEVGVMLVSTDWKNMSLTDEEKDYIEKIDNNKMLLGIEEAKEWAEQSPELFWYVSFVDNRPLFPKSIAMAILHQLVAEKEASNNSDESHKETESAHEDETHEQENDKIQDDHNDGNHVKQ